MKLSYDDIIITNHMNNSMIQSAYYNFLHMIPTLDRAREIYEEALLIDQDVWIEYHTSIHLDLLIFPNQEKEVSGS